MFLIIFGNERIQGVVIRYGVETILEFILFLFWSELNTPVL